MRKININDDVKIISKNENGIVYRINKKNNTYSIKLETHCLIVKEEDLEIITPKNPKIGIYETDYGNAAEYNPDEYGEFAAWDLDMREEIPVEMIDFTKFIRELD